MKKFPNPKAMLDLVDRGMWSDAQTRILIERYDNALDRLDARQDEDGSQHDEIDRLRFALSEMEHRAKTAESKLEKRTAALRESVTAIDDWIRMTAPEHCGADHLAETYNRISSNGGTLAYAAALQAKNREALSDE